MRPSVPRWSRRSRTTGIDLTSGSRATVRRSSSKPEIEQATTGAPRPGGDAGASRAAGAPAEEHDAAGDEAWLHHMLAAEAALARAEASVGLITTDEAAAVGRASALLPFDVDAILEEAAETGTPVVPLLKRLRAAGAAQVHRGATSQDIVDTATMLVARNSLELLLKHLAEASDACAGLARRHRDTLMVGRTLLQAALPTTFGLKAAAWI